jgi:hypothetical protein
MARTRANGMDIEYEAVGDPSHPAMLLITGWALSSSIGPTPFARDLQRAAYTSFASTIATVVCRRIWIPRADPTSPAWSAR